MADRDVLRALAARWMELAAEPVMAERKRAWTALHDLRGERPMVLFETWTLEDYLADVELQCTDPLFRGVEWRMRWILRHAEEVGDDLVVEPVWRVGWDIGGTGYGVDIRMEKATDTAGASHGYHYHHPIQSPEQLDQLVPRTWTVNRESTQRRVETLAAAFGDLLPVVLHGTEALCPGLTGDVFRLIGNENLLMWPFDHPEAIHRLMAYLRDDRLRYYEWLEAEGLLGLNHHFVAVGSGSPGLTSELPAAGYTGRARLRDLWAGVESQETTMISPPMFGEFFLPYMAEVAARFGLVYYGCCEPIHDRWHLIHEAIPHVRSCTVSPWCDLTEAGRLFGREVVFSRKPRPAPISGPVPDWDALKADLDATAEAARGCNLELIFRDVYRICGDRPRLRRWAELARERTAVAV